VLAPLFAFVFSVPDVVVAQNNGQFYHSRSENVPLNSLLESVQNNRANKPNLSDTFREIPNRSFKVDTRTQQANSSAFSPGQVQRSMGQGATETIQAFDGADNEDNQRINGFRVSPPDPDGQVGPNHYVQMLNILTVIYDKEGNELAGGPFATSDFWLGFGGLCETENDGDPIVIYDENEDRWLVSQFVIPSFGTDYQQCVAISQTGDPLGGYNRYSFDFSGIGLNDYPKHGITSNAITIMSNIFGGGFQGTYIGAMDKAAMYAGDPANMVGENIGPTEFGFVAADLDGPDPGNIPALFATAMSQAGFFDIWEVDPNFADPPATTVNRIASIAIEGFNTDFCDLFREACINQPPPGANLETLSSRLMHRLQVRDFGAYRTMLASHSVNIGDAISGVKWYEMRESGGVWTKYQEGIFAPDDGNSRWMPSIAMNAAGDIGLGYSISSTSTFWSIGVAGQTAAESGSGIMDSEEEICRAGGGVQTGSARAGDYSSTSIDPTTDTFWHTNEYVPIGGSIAWSTGICEFELENDIIVPRTMHVAEITTDKISAGRKKKRGVAVVTIVDEDGAPVSGATVTGDFSGTFDETVTGITNDDGQVFFETQGKTRRHPRVEFCVSDVTGTLTYDPAENADPAYACDEDGDATSIHIAKLKVEKWGGRKQRGYAAVRIKDDKGNPVRGVEVEGQFGGTFDETVTATTSRRGWAFFKTSTRANRPVTVTFCVNSVSGDLPYDPADNGSTDWDCDANFKVAAVEETLDLNFVDANDPESISVSANYPNPFNPTTLIPFEIGQERYVNATVYNSLGQQVAVLADGYYQAGSHRLVFDGTGLNNGMYFFNFVSGDFSYSQRMTLMK